MLHEGWDWTVVGLLSEVRESMEFTRFEQILRGIEDLFASYGLGADTPFFTFPSVYSPSSSLSRLPTRHLDFEQCPVPSATPHPYRALT